MTEGKKERSGPLNIAVANCCVCWALLSASEHGPALQPGTRVSPTWTWAGTCLGKNTPVWWMCAQAASVGQLSARGRVTARGKGRRRTTFIQVSFPEGAGLAWLDCNHTQKNSSFGCFFSPEAEGLRSLTEGIVFHKFSRVFTSFLVASSCRDKGTARYSAFISWYIIRGRRQ